jgi:xylulose-5-phosphate/fructose-6-phosphate phosphoketolase
MNLPVPTIAINWLKNHHRFTNFIAASSLYLKSNFVLAQTLTHDDIKPRILGHWGTVPGLNLIYGGLDFLTHQTGQSTLLITGPGHGAPAILANLFLEGSLSKYYPNLQHNQAGMEYLIKQFSWPKGFPSHTYPGLPGSIHEGGELGYSLGTAFGAAFNNPELLVAAVIGDGEFETGALAASWHSNKFLNPKTDGAVLPIVHVNGYKISNPTIIGTMSDEEITDYFKGLGYQPMIVSQYSEGDIYETWLQTLMEAYSQIKHVQETYIDGTKPQWPAIILRTKKGWTGPAFNHDQKLEDNNYSHGIPLKNPKTDVYELGLLKKWLKSYDIKEFFKSDGSIVDSLFDFIPEEKKLIGQNQNAQFSPPVELELPSLEHFEVTVESRGSKPDSELGGFSKYIREILKNPYNRDKFRVFSPDESESNMLESVLEVTNKPYLWPVREWDKHIGTSGNFMEILSEQTLQSWMQGYNMTGRHGVLISYEAFLSIIASQIDQYIKFLRQSFDFSWRAKVPSLNYIATSSVWRQDHNGFTHQNPILINSMLSKHVDFVSVYFPVDINSMLVTMETVFKDQNSVNLIIAGKTDMPQWLTLTEARKQMEEAVMVWGWIGNEDEDGPDVVLSSAGDYQTVETLAAIQLLRELCPELKIRYVNISSLSCMGFGCKNRVCKTENALNKVFTTDKQVIMNFHGYPEVIKQLVAGEPISMRMKILGYVEKGTTTTPFDMQVKNGTSRYHVAIEAIIAAGMVNTEVYWAQEGLITTLNALIEKHKAYIKEYGEDIPEIKHWKWQ